MNDINGFCCECKWFIETAHIDQSVCKNKKCCVNLITGRTNKSVKCSEARNNLCGLSGKFFEDKDD